MDLHGHAMERLDHGLPADRLHTAMGSLFDERPSEHHGKESSRTVRVRHMDSPHSAIGQSTGSPWTVGGNPMDSPRTDPRTALDSPRTVLLINRHGVCHRKNSPQIAREQPAASPSTTHGHTAHGLRTAHGQPTHSISNQSSFSNDST